MDPYPRDAPRRVAVPAIVQHWRWVTFVHWDFAPELLAPIVPEPLELDTFDGRAWVSLTPFSTTCFLFGGVPLPGPVRFPETNVRTYVRGPDGRHGIWFLSLDVTNAANARLGRAIGLPYVRSDLEVDPTPHGFTYRGSRRDGPRVSYVASIRRGEPLEPAAIDAFLVNRWSAYVVHGPLVARVDVEHEPWPLHRATVDTVQPGLLHAHGIAVDVPPTVCHFAPYADAKLAFARIAGLGTSSGAGACAGDRRFQGKGL